MKWLRIFLLRPQVEAELVGTTRITGIVDKGVGKGAVLYSERRITDAATGELYATLAMSAFCRGDGGFAKSGGGPSGPSWPVNAIPERLIAHGSILNRPRCEVFTFV